MSVDEYKILRSQNVTLELGKYSKYPPYAFTEYGILMLLGLKEKRREISKKKINPK